MGLSTKLVMRQGQSLVMTPQLLQAIKLLQLSNLELNAYVEQELERNPLLERAEETSDPTEALPANEAAEAEAQQQNDYETSGEETFDSGREEGDWASEQIETDRGQLEQSLGTEVENDFDSDASTPAPEPVRDDPALAAVSMPSQPGGSSGEDAPNLEAYAAARPTLAEHLGEQLAVSVSDPVDRLIGHQIIESIDESGYMREDMAEMAERLGADLARFEHILSIIQTFDPSGIGARDLAECLAIQLREKDRFDPAMEALIANLPLLAKRDFAQLRKICGVEQDDLTEMLSEIRALDPKPGRAFDSGHVQPVVPDVSVRAASDGSWLVELNPEGLPRVLVNQTYAARVSAGCKTTTDKSYVAECLQNANWLTRSLEQRAQTILKVATEIVRQQDAFFAHGIEHLRPLNLKTVADAIGMHESTVSRVTSNKYLSCHRGLFEFKYFFTAAIPASAGGEAHSAESVRFRIKRMIDEERPDDVLSDDAIVLRLKESNINIARRTVAKYRESLRIPSSVERRREKSAMVQGAGA